MQRRWMIFGALAALSGCASGPDSVGLVPAPGTAAPLDWPPPPVEVDFPGRPAGEIHVYPDEFALYWTQPGGRARRYMVGIGRDGRYVSGTFHVGDKREWPSWTPTQAMIRREPELYGPHAAGMPGGPDNPLGSRALYLYRGGRDTMYRIHGTMDPSSVGKATSAGCIRLFNQDIMDLFDEIPSGTPVKVRTPGESRALEGEMIQQPNGYLVPANQVQTAAATPAP